MKKILIAGIGIGFILSGCAQKPMARSVVDLAGNLQVAGWKDTAEKPKKTEKIKLKDTDGDGVVDTLDKCPNTPKGLLVNHEGCPIIATLRINFDFNKYNVKKIYYSKIKKIAEAIKSNPNIKKIEVAGYTDNIGSEKYNLMLSKKRAQAVANLLIKYGVSPSKIVVKGFGEKYPLLPNTTETNRALNRRVEIVDVSN
jgi:OOP family OmpA-OmpF porin